MNSLKHNKKSGKILRTIFAAFFLLVLFIIFTSLGFVTGMVSSCSKDLPDTSKLFSYQPSQTTKIFSSDGQLIGTLYKENRSQVPITQIPYYMKASIIAIEDRRFYEHHGIDFIGILRALKSDIRHERVTQGASTITQQLARNIFLTPKVSLKRKIQEALLAIEIEKNYSKDEILELYLNQIYFGSGAYGIEAAAHTYFGKKASNLDLAECSVLAGLPQAPSVYSPHVNFKMSKERQKQVLKWMVTMGYISQEQADDAYNEKLKIVEPTAEFHTFKVPYFTTYVVQYLFSKYDSKLLFRGGLSIYTTIDLKMQKIAQKAVSDGVNQGLAGGLNCHQGAIIAIEPRTGFIKAMVGGIKFSQKDQFNRAWQARRQPGSSFKIFVYTAAIDNGFTPDTIVSDSPVSYNTGSETWSPQNDDRRYWGAMPLRRAIQWSRNVVAVKVAKQVGIEKVIQYAYRMGVKEPLEPNLSLALGSSVVTPLDMATGACVLANGGIKVEPTPIKLIKDSDGNIIEDNTAPRQEEAISASTAYTMTELLQGVVEGGTGTRAQIGRPAAGKTGTTSDCRDAWFVGYTPDMAAAVWIGNDDYTRMYYSYGGYIPATIWANFMKQVLAKKPKTAFSKYSSDYVEVLICTVSHKRATEGCKKVQKMFFRRDEIPGYCTLHGGIPSNSKPSTKKETPKEVKETPENENSPEKEIPPVEESTPSVSQPVETEAPPVTITPEVTPAPEPKPTSSPEKTGGTTNL
ncbi:MAG: PBP1A family penicillin-binding protein [Firmicutes bacterium]|nr:PBP1A family penicillin-binding protein [Bacillota bacterium]